MHQFHKGIERRLTALEKRMASVPTTETAAERARRHELVRSAHVGNVPGDLTDSERPVFARIKATVPILQELISEGIIGPDGRPGGGDDSCNGIVTMDEDGDGAPVWRP